MKRSFLFVFIVACVTVQGQDLSIESLGLKVPVVKCTPVKDQYMSSTCWSFSSNSFLESELMKNGKGLNDLSEIFVARYSLIRKIERHLQLKGINFFTPGGQFHDVMWVIKNYGMVPEEVYSGKGRGETNHNHAELDTLLAHFVKDCVSNGITILSPDQKTAIEKLLDHYFGPVPTEFNFGGKKYTARSFADQYLGLNPDDYAEITSYTHHPFYRSFILEDRYNWTGDSYYNVTMEDFLRITDHTLQNGFTVGWDGDAEDNYFKFYEGLAWMPGTITDFQGARQKAWEDSSTLLNHMMHITAVVKDNTDKKWYYIKNSWGNYSNSIGGFLFMREDYFKIRTVAIIVNKNAVPVDIRQKLGWKGE